MSFSRISASLVALCFSVTAAMADEVVLDPQTFATNIGSGNEFEIKSSQLALNTSMNADVIAFAKMMVEDHQKSEKDLVEAARQANITVPTGMLPRDEDQYTPLTTLSGKAFDDAYLAAQVNVHTNTWGLLVNYSKTGTAPSLATFAAVTAPLVQMHLERATQLAAVH